MMVSGQVKEESTCMKRRGREKERDKNPSTRIMKQDQNQLDHSLVLGGWGVGRDLE